jgi:signal transduction histidine kinase
MREIIKSKFLEVWGPFSRLVFIYCYNRVVILVMLLVLATQIVQAQKQGKLLIDSILHVLPNTSSDSERIKLYATISDVYLDIDNDKALTYADSSAMLANKINHKVGIAAASLLYGNVYNFNGNYKKAITHLLKAEDAYKALKDKGGMAKAFYTLGMSYERLSDYATSAKYYFNSLEINETIPNNYRAIGNCLSAIAVIYFFQKDFEKSLAYSERAIQNQKAANNLTGIANELFCMADTYHELDDSANAVRCNNSALALFDSLGNVFGKANVYTQLATVYKNNYPVAIDYLFKAKQLFNDVTPGSASANLNNGNIGKILVQIASMPTIPAYVKNVGLPQQKDALLKVAEQYLSTAVEVSKQTGDLDKEASFSAELSTAQALRNDYKNAYINIKKFHQIHDSLYSQENKNTIAGLESKREIELRDKQLQLHKLTIANQQKIRIGLLIGLALLCVIGVLLFRQNLTRKKTNAQLVALNNELDEANKLKARFFAILTHDLRSPVANLISFLRLQKREPGLLTEQQVADREQKITTSAEALLETMESMLLWSKGQMEHFTPQIRKVTAAELFDYLHTFFSSIEGVHFEFQNKENMVVNTDPDYMQTIMHNLTSNAVKAMKSQPNAVIKWSAFTENGKAVFTNKDNGPGINKNASDKLFDNSSTASGKSGFGFFIIRDLAKAIHCTITVVSQPGEGSTFRLEIP